MTVSEDVGFVFQLNTYDQPMVAALFEVTEIEAVVLIPVELEQGVKASLKGVADDKGDAFVTVAEIATARVLYERGHRNGETLRFYRQVMGWDQKRLAEATGLALREICAAEIIDNTDIPAVCWERLRAYDEEMEPQGPLPHVSISHIRAVAVRC